MIYRSIFREAVFFKLRKLLLRISLTVSQQSETEGGNNKENQNSCEEAMDVAASRDASAVKLPPEQQVTAPSSTTTVPTN